MEINAELCLYLWKVCVATSAGLFILYLAAVFSPFVVPYDQRLRPFFVNLSMMAIAAFYGFLYSVLFLFLNRNPFWKARFLHLASLSLSAVIGLVYEVRDDQKCQIESNGVILVNHQADFDLSSIFYVAPAIIDPIVSAKREILTLPPPFSTGAYFSNTIFLDRHYPAAALSYLIRRFGEIMSENKCAKLVIHPEGTRNVDENGTYPKKFLPFRKGGFKVAARYGIPIYPLVISPYYFMSNKKFTPGKVIMKFLDPVQLNSDDDLKAKAEEVRQSMFTEYVKLGQELGLKDLIM